MNQTKSTFAIGNDVMQLAEALIDAYRDPASCGVDFLDADRRRGSANRVGPIGFSAMISCSAAQRKTERRLDLQPRRTARPERTKTDVVCGGVPGL